MASTAQSESPASKDHVMTLNIRSQSELRAMMREMLPDFVRVVDPRLDGLVDVLYGSLVLTDTDNESLSGKDVVTRKDQARKLWFLLNQVPVEDFLSVVAPELCRLYPYIIPSRFVSHVDPGGGPEQGGEAEDPLEACVRCAVQGRIRAASMADMLYTRGFLDLEDYGDLISDKSEADAVWESIFSKFCERTESEAEVLVEGVRELLRHNHMKVPPADCLKAVVASGVQCTCHTPVSAPPSTTSVPDRKVGSWLKKTRFSQARSSATSKTTCQPTSVYSSFASQTSVSSHVTAAKCEAAAEGEPSAATKETAITIDEEPTAEEVHNDVGTSVKTILQKTNILSESRPLFAMLIVCFIISILLGFSNMLNGNNVFQMQQRLDAFSRFTQIQIEIDRNLSFALGNLSHFSDDVVKKHNMLVGAVLRFTQTQIEIDRNFSFALGNLSHFSEDVAKKHKVLVGAHSSLVDKTNEVIRKVNEMAISERHMFWQNPWTILMRK